MPGRPAGLLVLLLSTRALPARALQERRDARPGPRRHPGAEAEAESAAGSSVWQLTAPLAAMPKADAKLRRESIRTMGFEDAIKYFRKADKRVCITYQAQSPGTLANAVGVISSVLDFSMTSGAEFIMPEIKVPGRGNRSSFEELFGPSPEPSEPVLAWSATCPLPRGSRPSPSYYPSLSEGLRLRAQKGCGCGMVDLEVGGAGTRALAPKLGCHAVFVVGSHFAWHFDYTRTGNVLSALYWKHLGKQISTRRTWTYPLSVAMHVHEVDVEGRGKVFPDVAAYTGMVVALTQALDGRCLNVSLVTAGDGASQGVQLIKKAWQRADVNPQVFDDRIPMADAFNILTHANILLGGGGGFVRLAAVLGQGDVLVFIDDGKVPHPLTFKPQAITVPMNVSTNATSMATQVRNHTQVEGLAAGCTAYLSRLSKSY